MIDPRCRSEAKFLVEMGLGVCFIRYWARALFANLDWLARLLASGEFLEIFYFKIHVDGIVVRGFRGAGAGLRD